MIPIFAAVAALVASSAQPAAPWAELTVMGRRFNPTSETWEFGLAQNGAVYVTRASGTRAAPAISFSLAQSTACPAIRMRIGELASVQRARGIKAPQSLDGLDYQLTVISPRPVAGVRGPLHLAGDDLSPLAAWTSRLAQTIDRCNGQHRRPPIRRPSAPRP